MVGSGGLRVVMGLVCILNSMLRGFLIKKATVEERGNEPYISLQQSWLDIG